MSPPLEPLELVIEPAGGPLLPQVQRALAERIGPGAEALRWAITRHHPPASGMGMGMARLTIEAVVWRQP